MGLRPATLPAQPSHNEVQTMWWDKLTKSHATSIARACTMLESWVPLPAPSIMGRRSVDHKDHTKANKRKETLEWASYYLENTFEVGTLDPQNRSDSCMPLMVCPALVMAMKPS